ncbi:hypothetical protein MPSEU_000619900 [Mayamaea pseudoterrestris]|nr:hypothetical protein MPSEU_000619900 [Mayamaea pseudoterrestris]
MRSTTKTSCFIHTTPMYRFLLLIFLLESWRVDPFTVLKPVPAKRIRQSTQRSQISSLLFGNNNYNADDESISYSAAELVDDEDDDADSFGLNDTESDWIPDRVKAKERREAKRVRVERIVEEQQTAKVEADTTAEQADDNDTSDPMLLQKPRASPYNDEQERLIASMGGKLPQTAMREPGYLGDCTLQEIASDYSVPVCYLADVLCMWNVPVPIDVRSTRLGDMVTGEQAFAILEAVNSLDIAALQDRYSNDNIVQLCANWELDLPQVFQFCVSEGWSLPFGVRTCLRVEQVEELLRVMQKI